MKSLSQLCCSGFSRYEAFDNQEIETLHSSLMYVDRWRIDTHLHLSKVFSDNCYSTDLLEMKVHKYYVKLTIPIYF